ncbi:MAG: hypothetical protein AAFY19_12280, partial [Pseudomonadota bacterium]
MMRRFWLGLGMAGAMGGALASGFAMAQRAPESLLPPGFDNPTPTPPPPPTPAPLPTAAPVAPAPGVAPPGTPPV